MLTMRQIKPTSMFLEVMADELQPQLESSEAVVEYELVLQKKKKKKKRDNTKDYREIYF